jgi:hypothetical protein
MNKPTFTRLSAPKFVNDLIREAKRVKYTVERDGLTFTVKDGEELVFKGVRVNPNMYAVTFSKKYWNEAE